MSHASLITAGARVSHVEILRASSVDVRFAYSNRQLLGRFDRRLRVKSERRRVNFEFGKIGLPRSRKKRFGPSNLEFQCPSALGSLLTPRA
jgi:hypothetical protein